MNRAFMLAALLAPAVAFGATVDTVTFWNGDLANNSTKDGLTMTGGTGCTFSNGKATTTASSSTAYTGLLVDLSNDANAASNITVLVKYSGFEQGSAQNNAILGILLGANNELLLGYKEADGIKIFSGVTSSASGSSRATYKFANGLPKEGAIMMTVVGTATTYKGVFVYLAERGDDGMYKPFNLLTYWNTTGTEFSDATKFLGIKVGGSISRIGSYHRPKMVIEGVAINYGLSDRIMFPNEAWFPKTLGYVKKTDQLFMKGITLGILSNALFTAHANGASMTVKDAVASGYLPTYTTEGGVLTSMTRRFCAADDDYLKSVKVTFSQKGDDVYYKADSAGYVNGRTTDPTTVATWTARNVAESATQQQYGFYDVAVTVPYTQTTDISGTKNWSGISWKKGVNRSASATKPTKDTDVTGLQLTGATVLTVNESVKTGVLKVRSTTKLTLKYTNTARLISAVHWDFSEAAGKVVLNCSTLAAGTTLVLMSGTIVGTENIDVAGSAIPSGCRLVVTENEVAIRGFSTWTNGAKDNDITNANNWTGGNPFSGGTFTGEVRLGADANWSAATLTSLNGMTIDLNGHMLTVTNLGGAGTITDLTSDAKNPGVLVLQVAEDTTWENKTIILGGNLKFVKEGAGTFVSRLQDQNYTGGTVVNAGTVKSVGYELYFYYGADATPFTINKGGVLDINGQYSWYRHHIYLNGGELRNSSGNQTTYANKGLGDVTLTADSTAYIGAHTLFHYDGAKLDLGGYTLTVTGKNTYFSFSNGTDAYTIANGTLVISTGAQLNTRVAAVDMKTVDLVIEADGKWLHSNAEFTVRDLDMENDTGSAKLVYVTGTFKSVNSAFKYIRLMSGATLDLTGNTGVFETADKNFTFDDQSVITVNLAGRDDMTVGSEVVSWDAAPNATFRLDDATMKKGVIAVVADEGLYLAPAGGLVIGVR